MQATNDDQLYRRPFTVSEFLSMERLGIFRDDECVELLDGELITLPPMGGGRAAAADALSRLLHEKIADRALIAPQSPVTLDATSAPRPELMLTALPPERYWKALPTPDDALLVVEIAAGTLAYDRGSKRRAYARSGVREYWIVDLVHERVDIYRAPRGGRYTKHSTLRRGETVAPEAFPDAVVPVDEILPPPAKT